LAAVHEYLLAVDQDFSSPPAQINIVLDYCDAQPIYAMGHFRPRQLTLPPGYFRFAPIRDITLSSSAARSAPPPIAMERRLRAGLSGVFRKRAAGFGFRGCCRN
jgi:hypothetical protein